MSRSIMATLNKRLGVTTMYLGYIFRLSNPEVGLKK